MDGFSQKLSEKISEIYVCVTRLEENALKKGNIHLSINEMHLLSVVKAHSKGLMLSDLAEKLEIRRPSATVAVNKLVAKGYLFKESVESDGRAIRVLLTNEGKRVCLLHRRCQQNVISELGNELSEEQRDILLKAVDRLDHYFKNSAKA